MSEELRREKIDSIRNAIALVTAFHTEEGAKLWETVFEELSTAEKEDAAYALTLLCSNVLESFAKHSNSTFDVLMNGIGMAFEKYFDTLENP